MTWQASRRRELWAAFLEPAALLIGVWGLVFDQIWMICSFIGLRLLLGLLRPTGWKAKGLDVTIFLSYLCVMAQIPPIVKDVSLVANAVLPWLLVSSVLHILVFHGHAERLLDKLIESGEFQSDHEKLDRWLKGELTRPPHFSDS